MHILERENNTVQDEELHTKHRRLNTETQFSINDAGRIVARRYIPNAEDLLEEHREKLEQMKEDDAAEWEIEDQQERVEALEDWQTEKLIVFDKQESRQLIRFIENRM